MNQETKKFHNIPNLFSYFRAAVTIIIFVALFIDISFILLQILVVLAILSDKLDGFCARRFNQITKFGSLLDSLVDAAFITICILYAILKLDFPILILLFGLPFVIIVLLAYLISAILKKKILSFWDFGKRPESKMSAIILFALIIFYFFNLPGKEYFAWLMLIFIYIYLVYYFYLVIKNAKQK